MSARHLSPQRAANAFVADLRSRLAGLPIAQSGRRIVMTEPKLSVPIAVASDLEIVRPVGEALDHDFAEASASVRPLSGRALSQPYRPRGMVPTASRPRSIDRNISADARENALGRAAREHNIRRSAGGCTRTVSRTQLAADVLIRGVSALRARRSSEMPLSATGNGKTNHG